MKQKIFSVYDSKAEVFNTPFFMANAGMATRAFGDLVEDRTTTIHRHPGDYVLYEIGEFDDVTGQVKHHAEHVHLGVGTNYVKEALNELRQ